MLAASELCVRARGLHARRLARPDASADSDRVDALLLRHARPCAGHPRLSLSALEKIDVDGRDKPGHDVESWFQIIGARASLARVAAAISYELPRRPSPLALILRCPRATPWSLPPR